MNGLHIVKKKVLITGGSGLLAMNWASTLRYDIEVCLLTHLQKVNMPGVKSEIVNLEDLESIKKIFIDFNPDVVVNTVGLTNVDECESFPDKAKLTNTTIACNLAKIAHLTKKKFVHISTDHLFAGENPLVDENEITTPLNVYAKTKVDAESCVFQEEPTALVIRTNFYGCGHKNRQSFSDWIIKSLTEGESIVAFDDVYFTPILIDDLVRSVMELIKINTSGIINIVGNERISKYKFATTLAKVFNLDESLIKKGRAKDVQFNAARPKDMSLSNQKLIQLIDYRPHNLIPALKLLKEQFIAGRSKILDESLVS